MPDNLPRTSHLQQAYALVTLDFAQDVVQAIMWMLLGSVQLLGTRGYQTFGAQFRSRTRHWPEMSSSITAAVICVMLISEHA